MSDTENPEFDREPVMLSDAVGIIGLTNRDFGEFEDHGTTVAFSELKRAVEIVDALGWKQVDVNLVESPNDEADYPILAFRYPGGLFGGDPGAVTVAPRTEQGRERWRGGE